MPFNNSNKSPIILFLHAVFLIPFIFQNNYSQERNWTFVGTDEKETMSAYVDTNSKRRSDGNLFVWEKLVRADANFVIGLVEWDCLQKRSRVVQQTLYNRYGEPQELSKNFDWIYTIDGTLGASIYKMVCRKPKNKSDYPIATTASKSSLAEIISTAASLRELPNINSAVIRTVSKRERLILVDKLPRGNWYRVIDNITQSEGWLHKTTFRIIKPTRTLKKRKNRPMQFD